MADKEIKIHRRVIRIFPMTKGENDRSVRRALPVHDNGHPWVRQHSFVEIGNEIILSLPLIQVGQLSVTGERMCT